MTVLKTGNGRADLHRQRRESVHIGSNPAFRPPEFPTILLIGIAELAAIFTEMRKPTILI